MKNVRLRAVSTPAVPDRASRMTTLDEICRQKVAEIIQAALVAEADEFLGRIAGFRRAARPGIVTATKSRARSPSGALR